ncbi:MAG: hypothetical protein ABSE52_06575 [Candidatus Dormibacteria bacterium]
MTGRSPPDPTPLNGAINCVEVAGSALSTVGWPQPPITRVATTLVPSEIQTPLGERLTTTSSPAVARQL